MINLALTLSQEHTLDLVLPYYLHAEKDVAQSKLKGLSGNIHFVRYPNYSTIRKKFFGIVRKISGLLKPQIDEIFYPTFPSVIREIARIIEGGSYDIVQLEYWYQARVFKRISNSLVKVIDTNDVLFEKRMLEMDVLTHSKWNEKLILKYKTLELQAYQSADVLISISVPDYQFFSSRFPLAKHIIIPTGQYLKKFLEHKAPVQKDDIILFYGSMSGEQNIFAFWRLYEKIFPRIKSILPLSRLLVVGANPPQNICALNSLNAVEVTGFVDDLGSALSRAKIMILPMEISGGFRSRVVEVMALGIPIIGTSNALDNIGFESGKHGFIANSDEAIADIAVTLFKNDNLRLLIGENCRHFCNENFSIEATYDKLAEFYKNV
jgi:glycosyltransferase involved in cell wall biosynthesis